MEAAEIPGRVVALVAQGDKRKAADSLSNCDGNGTASVTPKSMLGESNAMKQVWRCVELVAPADMTVLILGETGTGKELVARAVHEGSVRKNWPLISVNCSALPGELIE